MSKRLAAVVTSILAALMISTLTFCSHVEVGPVQPQRGLTVDPPLPLTFAVLGDSRPKHDLEFGMESAKGIAAKVMQRIADESPAFVLHLGDIATRGGIARYWGAFDRDATPIRDKGIPFYAVIGNHELMGGSVVDGLKNYFARFPHLDGKRWYSLRVRNLLIVALDSNFGDLTGEEIEAQNRWLEATLKKAEADAGIAFVVVAGHHPPYSNAAIHGGNSDVQSRFVARARACKKVKILFAGHVHSYERFRMEDGIMYVVSGGGGSPRHTLASGENARYKDLYKAPPFRNFHFCRLTLREDVLVCDMMAYDEKTGLWSVADTFECRR